MDVITLLAVLLNRLQFHDQQHDAVNVDQDDREHDHLNAERLDHTDDNCHCSYSSCHIAFFASKLLKILLLNPTLSF